MALSLLLTLNLMTPLTAVQAQEAVDASGNPTGPQSCTGASCTQGFDQGFDQGLSNGVEASNTDTGADSNNQNDVTADASTTTDVDNTSNTNTDAAATANSGSNTTSSNSDASSIETGDAGIGVTQVINDNTTVLGGTAGLQVSGHDGDYNGDLNLGFGSGTANLLNTDGGGSVRATNDTTGSNSTNGTTVTTTTEQINEVQNDGVINNLLELAALTGQNEASMNTGDSAITTGDANVAATLVNLLNTTVINGNLWVTITDIFGDLNGNINIPDFAAWFASYQAQNLAVDATNSNTGADSTNQVNVGLTDTETTTVINDADINTTVTANAITGQNDALGNTGGATVTTGDATASASNVTLANTTIEGGNWGIFIVNALNGWLGFLVGDNGQVQALSQEETLQHVQAQNSNTGADSDNTVDVDHTRTVTDTVTNDASITNVVTASAITGQNDTNFNTGATTVDTGDANIQATTVNIANTTVKNGSLFIAVVNVFGDWFGDLLYGGTSVAATAAANSAAVQVAAANDTTGADSTNEVNVDYNRDHTTRITNDADIATTLNANIDTGGNNANSNTGAARVTTGGGFLAMHTRTAANLVGLAGASNLGIDILGMNDTTGENSENRIRANINDTRVIAINNDANVSTALGSAGTPAQVNTGSNNANMNTLGAMIVTGNASADVAIQNLVNQVILSLAGRGMSVDANFTNTLTGALSTNTAELTAMQRTLVDIVNNGLIDNLINLLLNTGGNATNQNTGEVVISTGAGCVEVNVDNNLNRTKGAKKVAGDTTVNAAGNNSITGPDSTNTTGTTVGQQKTVNVANTGTINNDAQVDANTGNNQQNSNTGAPVTTSGSTSECPKIAMAPSPTPPPSVPSPTPTPASVGGGEPSGNGGGGDQGPDQPMGGGEANPRIAGVTTSSKQPTISPAKGILKRFPVAGGEVYARLLPGHKRLPWQVFIIGSLALVAAAWSFDRKAKAKHLGSIA